MVGLSEVQDLGTACPGLEFQWETSHLVIILYDKVVVNSSKSGYNSKHCAQC